MSISTEITRLQNAKASIKSSIEAKGVSVPSSAKLDSYSGYVDQITGGGGTVQSKDVNFYDYDGTLLYSYTTAEAKALTAMPALPDHSSIGLDSTSQYSGWNWTLAQLQNINHLADIGALYDTTDTYTHIWVNVATDDMKTMYTMIKNAHINWGDGNEEDVSGSVNWPYLHTYSTTGIYEVIVSPLSGAGSIDWISTSLRATFYNSNYGASSGDYKPVIDKYQIKAQIGSTASSGTVPCICQGSTIETITLNKRLAGMSTNDPFNYCGKLKALVVPERSRVDDNNAYRIEGMYSLKVLCTAYEHYEGASLPNFQNTTGGVLERLCFCGAGIAGTVNKQYQDLPYLKQIDIAVPCSSPNSSWLSFYNLPSLKEAYVVPNIGRVKYANCYHFSAPDLSHGVDMQYLMGNKVIENITIPNTVTILQQYAFSGMTQLKNIVLSQNLTTLEQYCFQSCQSLFNITLPSTVTTIGNDCFSYCCNLTSLYCKAATPPTLGLNVFQYTPIRKIIVPASSVNAYKTALGWSSYADIIVGDFTITECTSLSITADNIINGMVANTTIHYTAVCNGTTVEGEQRIGVTITGDDTVNVGQNTSTTETVTKTVNYTFYSKSASTTITQAPWSETFNVNVELTGIGSYDWEEVTAGPPTGFIGKEYKSLNYHVGNSQAVMKLTVTEAGPLNIYLRSDGEDNYDYVMSSTVNAASYPTEYSQATCFFHLRGQRKAEESAANYTKVSYGNLSVGDYVYIVYRKDSNGDTGTDTGYLVLQYKGL